jgi:hypothetical protein
LEMLGAGVRVKKGAESTAPLGLVAGPTRLELATSGVTGRRSNQLNYDPAWVDPRQVRS